MPSFAPNTAARSHPVCSVRCRSLWRTGILDACPFSKPDPRELNREWLMRQEPQPASAARPGQQLPQHLPTQCAPN
jgi:hypothetical protein